MVSLSNIHYGGVRLQADAIFYAFLQDTGDELLIFKGAHFFFKKCSPIDHLKNRFILGFDFYEKFWRKICLEVLECLAYEFFWRLVFRDLVGVRKEVSFQAH